MVDEKSFGKIIRNLSTLPKLHTRPSQAYDLIDELIKNMIANSNLSYKKSSIIEMEPFGTINFPYTKMGAIDSLDLFGLDELIIFSFYWKNRKKYKKAVDIGANIGLHSIIMARCGWSVTSYEPDPVHADLLKRNLVLNNINTVNLQEKAVSNQVGTVEFIRVKGNTTGSHLAGAKSNPYGELDRFPVRVDSFKNVIDDIDFVKVDAEGHETSLILSTEKKNWEKLEMIAEVGTFQNAELIFNHLSSINVNIFAQKIGWELVTDIMHMPTSHREGSIFVSSKKNMSW